MVGKSISHEEDVLDKFGNAVVYKRGSKIHKKGEVKRHTISDHTGGTLRRGWTSKTQEEAESGTGNGENPRKYAAEMRVEKQGNSYVIEVKNPVEYASYVEFGHRQTPGRYVPALGKRLTKAWVKGQFMLTTSENEISEVITFQKGKIVQLQRYKDRVDLLNVLLKSGIRTGKFIRE